jgi:carbonic anhydrase
MSTPRLGTAINCIDGRVQEPVTQWMKAEYRLDYVDMITLPGPDEALVRGLVEVVDHVKSAVRVSIQQHGSSVVAIAGHHDCTANPVPAAEHLAQIKQCVQIIRSWHFSVVAVGLWVNDRWQVELV